MQQNYKAISKLEVELTQLPEAEVPTRPRKLIFIFLFYLLYNLSYINLNIARPGYLHFELRPFNNTGLIVVWNDIYYFVFVRFLF